MAARKNRPGKHIDVSAQKLQDKVVTLVPITTPEFTPLSLTEAKRVDHTVMTTEELNTRVGYKIQHKPLSKQAQHRHLEHFNADFSNIKDKCPREFWELIQNIATGTGRQLSRTEYDFLVNTELSKLTKKATEPKHKEPELHLVSKKEEKAKATRCEFGSDCYNLVKPEAAQFLTRKDGTNVGICEEHCKVLRLKKPDIVFKTMTEILAEVAALEQAKKDNATADALLAELDI